MSLEYIFNDAGASLFPKLEDRRNGDCFVRAYTILTGTKYATNYWRIGGMVCKWRMDAKTPFARLSLRDWRKLPIYQTKHLFADGTSSEVSLPILEKMGMKHFDNVGYGFTMEELVNRFGDGFASMQQHITAVKNGALQDLFDCRHFPILSYWYF